MSAVPTRQASHLFQVTHCDQDATIARTGRLVLTIVRGQSSRIAMAQARRACAEVMKAEGAIVAVNVIGQDASMPSGDAVQEIRAMNGDFGTKLRGGLLVLEGDGLWRSSMRLAARAIMIPMRHRHPFEIVSAFEEGAVWLRQHASVQASLLAPAVRACLRAGPTGCADCPRKELVSDSVRPPLNMNRDS